MPIFTHTLDIAASPEQVFAVLSDTNLTPHWQPRCTRIDKLTEGPVREGTALRYFYKDGRREGQMEGKVTAAEPGRRFAMTYADKMMTVGVDFAGAASPTGTRLTHTIHIQPSGFARIFTPFITRTLPKQTVTSMEQLKALVEHETRTGRA
jgi:uncharacterized protein YndB with AHSA1/START domain